MMKIKDSLFYKLCFLALFVLSYAQNGGLITIQTNTTNFLTQTTNPGCKTFINGICQQCHQGYLLYNDAKCLKLIQNCRLINIQAGVCQLCNDGYQNINGICSLISSIPIQDPGCRIWSNNICQQCSERYFFNQNRKCEKIDDNCQTWNDSGNCLSCYMGYDLISGKCGLSKNNPAAFNTLCRRFVGNVCVECSYRAFFDKDNICKQVDRKCNTFDPINGNCLTCYEGFILINGNCTFSNNINHSDSLCLTFDYQKNICLECSYRSYKDKNGVCIQVNPLCQTFKQGSCLSCYSGYTLNQGQCLIKKQVTATEPIDLGCLRWDYTHKRCLQCSYRYYLNSNNGRCSRVSDLCKTYDLLTGKCLSCYDGFGLKDNVCKKISSFCRTYDNMAGECTSCYQGYLLRNGACQIQTEKSVTGGCFVFDTQKNQCINCLSDYCLNQKKFCVKKPENCQTCDQINGGCAICNAGYFLEKGQCVQFKIIGCKKSFNNYCTQCQQDFLQFDGICINIGELRKVFNLNVQAKL